MREKSVRAKLKSWFNDEIYWIEQSRGSTNGFPDALACIIYEGRHTLLPIEAKVAEFTEDYVLKSRIKDIFRPAQISTLHRLKEQNQPVLILIGQENDTLPQTFAISDNFSLFRAIKTEKQLKIWPCHTVQHLFLCLNRVITSKAS